MPLMEREAGGGQLVSNSRKELFVKGKGVISRHCRGIATGEGGTKSEDGGRPNKTSEFRYLNTKNGSGEGDLGSL